jgi:hypothetical protein
MGYKEVTMYERTTKTVEQACAAKAERVGYALRVVYPEPNELFLDYDSTADYDRGVDLLAIAIREGVVVTYTTKQSPSGRGYHVTCRVPRPLASVHEQLALQAALGSDPKRELLAFIRHADGAEERTLSVFFERV